MPNYEPIEHFADCPRIFVHIDMFRRVPPGVTIEWTSGWTDGGYCSVVAARKPCHEACMKGVVIKLAQPPRVWRLTGRAQTERLSDGTTINLLGYEATWPD